MTDFSLYLGFFIFNQFIHKCFNSLQKKKGLFHHSSFLAGGATLAAGRLEAEEGVLKVLTWISCLYCLVS